MDNSYHSQYNEVNKEHTKFLCLHRTVTVFPLNK